MAAYYNEHDPFAAAWLRELIKAGLIADGEVDERDIQDVQPDDLRGFVQCHFFAGIGGWSYALRLAGWPDDRPVWTGSCPCQPFSAAGRGQGEQDARHLWPVWRALIGECRPATIFGEQVAGKAGGEWLSEVRADLEDQAFAVGAADLPAASVGAWHVRQRLWFVADTTGEGRSRLLRPELRASDESQKAWQAVALDSRRCSEIRSGGSFLGEPCFFTSAHGIPEVVGRLRGYGNAIVPQVGAAFIQAYCEARGL